MPLYQRSQRTPEKKVPGQPTAPTTPGETPGATAR
jgi:hypothetical protein